MMLSSCLHIRPPSTPNGCVALAAIAIPVVSGKQTEPPNERAGNDRESGIAQTCDLRNSLISRELLLVGGHSAGDKARGGPLAKRTWNSSQERKRRRRWRALPTTAEAGPDRMGGENQRACDFGPNQRASEPALSG